MRKKHTKEDAEKLVQKVKVNFQRLTGAEEFFRRDLSIEIFQNLTATERESLEIAFAKRHVLTRSCRKFLITWILTRSVKLKKSFSRLG